MMCKDPSASVRWVINKPLTWCDACYLRQESTIMHNELQRHSMVKPTNVLRSNTPELIAHGALAADWWEDCL
jgi:hypothetical protein